MPDLAPLLRTIKLRGEDVPAAFPDPLAAVRTEVLASPFTLRARVLERLIRGLHAGSSDLREADLAALDRRDTALAAALIAGRISGVYASAEWEAAVAEIEAAKEGADA